jgi:hypothetical protein
MVGPAAGVKRASAFAVTDTDEIRLSRQAAGGRRQTLAQDSLEFVYLQLGLGVIQRLYKCPAKVEGFGIAVGCDTALRPMPWHTEDHMLHMIHRCSCT